MTEASSLLFAAPVALMALAMAMMVFAQAVEPVRKPVRIAVRRDHVRR